MHAEVSLPLSLVFSFLLVLARVGGAFVFVPLPGIRQGPDMARVALVISLTLVLCPQWPAVGADPGIGRLVVWMLAEAALGITIGLAVAFITEAFVLCAQIVGLQAGYAYASVVDPNTQADAGILLVLAELISGMLFFAMGLDREVVRIFARSLTVYPPGAFMLSRAGVEQVVSLGAAMFSTGLRLAMPVVGLLVLVDVALALLGRINAQLQLLTLAFPAKMLATLFLLAWIAVLFPTIYRGYSSGILGTVEGVLGN